MHKAVLILINCNTTAEAEKIGKRLLKDRLVACIDIIPRTKTIYFWPPGKGKTKTGKGSTLAVVSLHKNIQMIEHLAEKLHSDKVPFISATDLIHISNSYYKWLILELK